MTAEVFCGRCSAPFGRVDKSEFLVANNREQLQLSTVQKEFSGRMLGGS